MIGLVMEPRLGRRIPSPVYSAHNCQAWDYPASPRAAVSPSDGAPDLKASARVSSSSSCTFPWLNVAFRARPRHWARNLLGLRKTYRRAGMYEADKPLFGGRASSKAAFSRAGRFALADRR